METKKCIRCGEVKREIDFFNDYKNGGKRNHCKKCHTTQSNQWRDKDSKENPEKYRKATHKYAKSHKKEKAERTRKYNASHPEKVKEWKLRERRRNGINARVLLTEEERYLRSLELVEYRKRYRELHREDSNIKLKEKYKNNIEHRLAVTIRNRINKAIISEIKPASAIRDLGCTVKELRFYLEGKFIDGMAWGNHGQWHIDHIIPFAFFNLTVREQFLKACHYTNLQPLWAKDNLTKSSKLPNGTNARERMSKRAGTSAKGARSI